MIDRWNSDFGPICGAILIHEFDIACVLPIGMSLYFVQV